MYCMEIRNNQGELLEVIAEGSSLENADKVLLLVHGFGTDLHEKGIFDELSHSVADSFPGFCVIRFSWSGCGKSEGIQ